MHQEIEFFREKLAPTSEVRWESPIAHIIPRMPTFTTFGDSCLEGAGGTCHFRTRSSIEPYYTSKIMPMAS
jgi:hypothetical protein